MGDATLGVTTPARTAVLFDWNNWWAVDDPIGPIREKEYVATVRKHYNTLWRRNVSVDVVFADSDLNRYAVVIAPMLHMVGPGFAERIEKFVLASDPEDRFLDDFYGRLLARHDVVPLLETPSGVEVALRETESRHLLFVLNHNAESQQLSLPAGRLVHDLIGDTEVSGSLDLSGYDVRILEDQ